MENREMVKFFGEKKKYQDEGYNFFWIFEVLYLDELRQMYGTKMEKLEQKLDTIPPRKLGQFLMSAFIQKKFEEPLTGVRIVHIASEEGFSKEDVVLIKNESTDETKQHKCERFINTFKQIVSNMKSIPDKSVIFLSSEQHKVVESGGKKIYLKENRTPQSMRKREQLSQARGQQVMTRYFKAIRNSSAVPCKKPIESKTVKSMIAAITQKLRGDNVRIVWLPKLHYELDPSQYISVFLLNEIYLLVHNNEDGKDLKTICSDALDRFPNETWGKAIQWANDCERKYLEKAEDDADDESSLVKQEKHFKEEQEEETQSRDST